MIPLPSSPHPVNITPHLYGEGLFAVSNVGELIKVEFKRKDGSVTIRHGVRLWWKGNRHDLFKIPAHNGKLVPCETEGAALQLKIIINEDIVRGNFHPERYKRERKLFIEQYSKSWLERREKDVEAGMLSAATLYDYKQSFTNWINSLIGNRFMEDITNKDLEDLMKGIKRKPAGIQNVMGALKKMYKDALRWEDIINMPIFPIIAVPDRPPVWLEQEDQLKIVDNLDDYAARLVTFMILTGCRTQDARAFRWQDIKKDHIEFTVAFDRFENLKAPKNGEVMTWPMTESLRALLDTVPENDSMFVFINPKTGCPYDKNFNREWEKAYKAAGFEYVKLYDATRHSFATQMANAENPVDESVLQRLLRQKDRKSTKKYYHYKTEPLKAAVNKVINFPIRGKKESEEEASVK